jgi:hypothetical protein
VRDEIVLRRRAVELYGADLAFADHAAIGDVGGGHRQDDRRRHEAPAISGLMAVFGRFRPSQRARPTTIT